MILKLQGRKGQVGDWSLELLEAGVSTSGSCGGERATEMDRTF